MIITISGFHGTGKSTVAKEVAKKFKLQYLAAGDMFRQMAKEKQMSLTEFSEFVAKNPEIDREIDKRTLEQAKKGNCILDGLLVGWKTRDISDISILLTADVEIRIKRIAQRENRSYEDVEKETIGRENIEIERFKKLYDINLNDYSIYDIVLNTALLSKESMNRIVIMLIEEYLKEI